MWERIEPYQTKSFSGNFKVSDMCHSGRCIYENWHGECTTKPPYPEDSNCAIMHREQAEEEDQIIVDGPFPLMEWVARMAGF